MSEAKRAYHSPARAAAAQETRRRIMESARRLFESRGYAATTLEAIAVDAGVATATVRQVFGGKAGLVRAQLDTIDAAGGLPALRAVLDRPDSTPSEVCRALARFLANLYEDVAPVLAAAAAAGARDERLKALADAGAHRHRMGITALASRWSGAGVLRDGMTADAAAAVVASISGPDVHRTLRQEWGWTPAQYEAWLADALERLVLAPPGATASAGSEGGA